MTSQQLDERLRDVAADLYGRQPEQFTAARTAAAKDARSGGDKPLATAVQGLRKPTVAAWAVNLLARRRAELVGQVLELGASLREAQASLQGEALRDLTRQRRQLVAAVTREARSLAAEEGHQLTEAVLRQVEETLQAAMASADAAEAVRSGLLAQPLSSTGLESLTDVVAVPVPRAPAEDRPALSVVRDEGRARREAEARLHAAEQGVRRATKVKDKADKAYEKGQARVLQVEAELEDLRRRLAEVETTAERAAADLEELQGAVTDAEAALEEARAEAEDAAAALDRLDG